MNICTATMESLTYAIKAKRLLAPIGISSDVVKVDSSRTGRGCEYGISFDCSQLDDIKRALANSGIHVKRYLRGGGELV